MLREHFMEAMRNSIDAMSYYQFDTALAMVQMTNAEFASITTISDARLQFESMLTQTVRHLRERGLNTMVTALHPKKTGKKSVDVESLGQPIMVSMMNHEDEQEPDNASSTEGEWAEDITEVRADMSVQSAVDHAVQSGSLKATISTFQLHNESEYLKRSEEFSILVYAIQFSTDKANQESNTNRLGEFKPEDFPTYTSCLGKRDLPAGIKPEDIDTEVAKLFTAEVNDMTIPMRNTEKKTDAHCEGCGHRYHKLETCMNTRKVVVDGKDRIVICEQVYAMLLWKYGTEAIARKLDKAIDNGCLQQLKSLPYAGFYIDSIMAYVKSKVPAYVQTRSSYSGRGPSGPGGGYRSGGG
jgi:hypothetical protein